MSKIETVKCVDLVMDFDLYPRSSHDSQHVSYIVEAIAAGEKLPPVIADRKSRRVIDGFHRIKAHLRHFGDLAEIEVEFRDYANDKEAFLAAIELNSRHGARLDRHDRVHCGIRAKELRIRRDLIANALHMSMGVYAKLMDDRTATSAGGQDVPLKQTIRHKAGQKLTKEQVAANKKLGGMSPIFYCNQLLTLIENSLLDMENARLVEKLHALRDAIDSAVGVS